MALCALMALPMMAGKESKAWNFTINDEGEVVVEQTFTTEKDGETAIKAIKSGINRQSFEDRSVLAEETGKSVEYDLQKNTKSSYNPFAGNFQESMRFKLIVRYENGKVFVRAESFNLISRYQGYGSRTNSDSFAGKIEVYENNKAGVENGTIKGKAKKEALDTNEDIDDSFNVCQKELDAIFTSIKRAL